MFDERLHLFANGTIEHDVCFVTNQRTSIVKLAKHFDDQHHIVCHDWEGSHSRIRQKGRQKQHIII